MKNAYTTKAPAGRMSRTGRYRQPFKRGCRRIGTDYNNHMNESRYLQCFSNATDGLLRMLGVDAEYIARGGSYFTVETHIRHINEVAALEPIYATTQILGATGKKLHLFHHLYRQEGRLLATGEHLLLHVDMNTKKNRRGGSRHHRQGHEISPPTRQPARPG